MHTVELTGMGTDWHEANEKGDSVEPSRLSNQPNNHHNNPGSNITQIQVSANCNGDHGGSADATLQGKRATLHPPRVARSSQPWLNDFHPFRIAGEKIAGQTRRPL